MTGHVLLGLASSETGKQHRTGGRVKHKEGKCEVYLKMQVSSLKHSVRHYWFPLGGIIVQKMDGKVAGSQKETGR